MLRPWKVQMKGCVILHKSENLLQKVYQMKKNKQKFSIKQAQYSKIHLIRITGDRMK